jgi:hypothetical protein
VLECIEEEEGESLSLLEGMSIFPAKPQSGAILPARHWSGSLTASSWSNHIMGDASSRRLQRKYRYVELE